MPVRWSLPADHSAAGLARRHVTSELESWENIDDIALVVSELTTNAVEHGGAAIDLSLELIQTRLRLTVASVAGIGEPGVRQAADDEDGGRGLRIVSLLAEDWGWSRDGDRLAVWADFPAG